MMSGRPPLYTPEKLRIAQEWHAQRKAGQRGTKAKARELGVSAETLRNWIYGRIKPWGRT